MTKSSFYENKTCKCFYEQYPTGGFPKKIRSSRSQCRDFFILFLLARMITQATGREAHQQTKGFEKYLIYENLLTQELVKKNCGKELVQEFVKKLKSTYEVNGDLIEILEQAKSQIKVN